jgi:phage terminase small subunit
MKLTGKQHDFAVAYVATGNATVAYREVYSTKSMSDRAVSVEACRLVNHPKISLKIAELREPVVKEANVTLSEVIQGLRDAAEIAKEVESATGLVAACRELARLSGLYPAKEHSHKVATTIGFADRLAAQRKQRKGETKHPS